jgi:hypothetical protein
MKIFSHNDQTVPARRQRRRLPLLVGSLVLIVSLMLAILNFTVFSSAQVAHAASWTQVWGDEFNGTAGTAPSSSNWLYDLGTSYPGGAGNWGTGEVESETNSTANVYQDGSGHLAIKPIRSASGQWTSGRIETQNSSFAAPAGGELAIEASLQMPNVTGAAAQGYWPAFWALGTAFRGNYNNWPGIGEIDAMENVNGTNMEYGTLHCGVSPGGPCNETTGRGGSTACTGTTCQAGFHTYRVEIDRSTSPEQVRWYLDGVEFWHVSSNDPGMDATTWSNAIHHGFFVILNVAIGGGWPGNPTASTTSGAPMLINYVHVFTSGGATGGSTPTVTPPTPTPTPTSGCTSGSFTSGVVSSSSSTALPWFKTCSWIAGYVIVHYTVAGGTQQNVYTTYNSSTGRWEYSVSGITSGKVLQYSFTYQKSGLQYDTSTTSWTHP